MKKEDDLGGEPAEETIEITPKKSYWKFVLGVSAVGIFALGYCLGGSCDSPAGTENVFGKLLSGTVSVSSHAFSNIFGNGSESGSESLRETIDLNKGERIVSPSPAAATRSGSLGLEKKTVEAVAETVAASVETTAAKKECRFDSAAVPSHAKLIISEVAWMGSKDNPRHEWVELQNISGGGLDISGWQMLDSDEKLKIIFSRGTSIPPQGFFLLKRGDESLPQIKADYVYSGGLENEGDGLRLFDSSCFLVDEIIANPTWPAGSASPKYLSAERSPDLSWHSYEGSGEAGIYGTPKGANSEPKPAQPVQTPQPIQNQSPTSGGGGGVNSAPAESISPTPSPSPPSSGGPATSTTTTEPPPPPSLTPSPPQETKSNVNHILISQIQITGGAGQTTNDFIEIYNPNNFQVNLNGYRLVKRTQTSTSDAPIKSWTTDVFIPANGYYLWANSGYTDIPTMPDITTAAIISNNNGIAIRSGSADTGTIIDSVAWGEAQNIFIEGTAFSTSLGPNQSLMRKAWQNNNCVSATDNLTGDGCDTNNNASDFEIRDIATPRNSQSI